MHFKINTLAIILFTALLLTQSILIAEENQGDAVAVVEKFHNVLLEVMQNAETLGYQGRYDALTPSFASNFDTPVIARVILGRYWSELDEQQQAEFIDLFNRKK